MIIGDTVKISMQDPRPWLHNQTGTIMGFPGWGEVRVDIPMHGKVYKVRIKRGDLEVIRPEQISVNREEVRKRNE